MNETIANATGWVVIINNARGDLSAIGDDEGAPFPDSTSATEFAEAFVKHTQFHVAYQVLPIIASALDT